MYRRSRATIVSEKSSGSFAICVLNSVKCGSGSVFVTKMMYQSRWPWTNHFTKTHLTEVSWTDAGGSSFVTKNTRLTTSLPIGIRVSSGWGFFSHFRHEIIPDCRILMPPHRCDSVRTILLFSYRNLPRIPEQCAAQIPAVASFITKSCRAIQLTRVAHPAEQLLQGHLVSQLIFVTKNTLSAVNSRAPA